MEYTFEKSTCEKYTIRWGKSGWAVFTIDEKGLFSCQSDCGDYQYMWPNHGRKTFKHFIIELSRDTSYLLNKVAKEDCFNFDKALEGWKREIINIRKEREVTKDLAREAWEFIHSLDDYSNNPEILQHELYNSDIMHQVCQEPWYVFNTDKDYSPQALAFANEVMPIFAEILKNELESI